MGWERWRQKVNLSSPPWGGASELLRSLSAYDRGPPSCLRGGHGYSHRSNLHSTREMLRKYLYQKKKPKNKKPIFFFLNDEIEREGRWENIFFLYQTEIFTWRTSFSFFSKTSEKKNNSHKNALWNLWKKVSIEYLVRKLYFIQSILMLTLNFWKDAWKNEIYSRNKVNLNL